MRVSLALACLIPTLALAAPVPKEIKKKPTSLAGTWKILELQGFGAQPSTNDGYWTMDEKGNSWFHPTETPPANAKPSDVNVADFDKGEMNHCAPHAAKDEFAMFGVFAFEGDVLIINYHMQNSGREKRPKGLELEVGGMRWKLRKNAESGK